MKILVAAFLVGIIGNMTKLMGESWPIGSVAAIVIVGGYLKHYIDVKFAALEQSIQDRAKAPEPEDTQ